jgi:predicted RND superfamily exporter protein
MFGRIASLVLRWPRLAGGLVLAFLAVAGAGTARLKMDFSAVEFFGGDDPARAALDSFEARWGRSDDALTVVVRAQDGSSLLQEGRLQRVAALADLLAATPGVGTVVSLPTSPLLLGEPGVLRLDVVRDVLPPAADPGWPAFREQLLRHPLYVPTLLSPDGTTLAIALELEGDTDDLAAVRPVVLGIREAVAGFEGKDGLHFATAGIPSVRADLIDVMIRDQQQVVPLGIAVIAGLLLLTFRRLEGALVPGIAAFVPTVVTFGVMGWTGEHIGLLNQAYTTLLPVLAVSDAIHMVSRYHEELRSILPVGARASPGQRDAAIVRAVQETGAACALNSLTTSVGFLSLGHSRMPILAGFGLYAAIGILAMYLTVLVLVPLALRLTSGVVPSGASEEGSTATDRLFLRLADIAVRRPFAVMGFSLVLLLGFGLAGMRTVVNNNLTEMLDPEHPTVEANRLADARLGGVLVVEADVFTAEDGLRDPAVLGPLLRFEDAARQHDGVRAVLGPGTWLATLQQIVTGHRAVPEAKAGVAQLLMLVEGQEALERAVDTARWDRGRITILCRDLGAVGIVPLVEAMQADADAILAGSGARAVVTGTPYIAYRGINAVTEDLLPGLGGAFLVMVVIFALLLRSPRAGLLAVLPNALPLVVGYGLMGLCGWNLDTGPAVCFTVALGIASDDTVHVTLRAREEVRRGLSMADAMRRTVFHTGRACAVTSFILATGFLLNLLASFPSLRILGALGAAILAAAMVAEIFLTPALFVAFASRLWRPGSQEPAGSSPVPAPSR